MNGDNAKVGDIIFGDGDDYGHGDGDGDGQGVVWEHNTGGGGGSFAFRNLYLGGLKQPYPRACYFLHGLLCTDPTDFRCLLIQARVKL